MSGAKKSMKRSSRRLLLKGGTWWNAKVAERSERANCLTKLTFIVARRNLADQNVSKFALTRPVHGYRKCNCCVQLHVTCCEPSPLSAVSTCSPRQALKNQEEQLDQREETLRQEPTSTDLE